MTVDLRKHNFLKLLDFTAEEINYLLDLASALKAAKRMDRKDIVGILESTGAAE